MFDIRGSGLVSFLGAVLSDGVRKWLDLEVSVWPIGL